MNSFRAFDASPPCRRRPCVPPRGRRLRLTAAGGGAAAALGVLSGCLYLKEIVDPAQPDDDSPSTLDVGACTPQDGEPAFLAGPGSAIVFRCFIQRGELVRWSLSVDGVERVVLQDAGDDALQYRLSYDELPRPLPATLSIKVVVSLGSLEVAREWPVELAR